MLKKVLFIVLFVSYLSADTLSLNTGNNTIYPSKFGDRDFTNIDIKCTTVYSFEYDKYAFAFLSPLMIPRVVLIIFSEEELEILAEGLVKFTNWSRIVINRNIDSSITKKITTINPTYFGWKTFEGNKSTEAHLYSFHLFFNYDPTSKEFYAIFKFDEMTNDKKTYRVSFSKIFISYKDVLILLKTFLNKKYVKNEIKKYKDLFK